MTSVVAGVFFGQTGTAMVGELGVLGSILLTLIGLVLHLYRHRHQISMEERVKDSKLSEEEARRQIRFYRICAPSVTLIGVALLTVVIFEMSS